MIQSIRGTKDILPDTIAQWQGVQDIFKKVSDQYGYIELRTPIFEKTEVFSRSIGENTDIVNKEMYTFKDKGDESITLRPEQTAALVRSVIQNSMIQQNSVQRLWYFGPFFRYERPQKGRLRQFHQYGAECIGSPYPESDAEVILLADRLIRDLGIVEYKLIINSLGNEESRKKYRTALIEYLNSKIDMLSEESRSRMETNPLRVLDSKDARDKEALIDAPRIIDYLDEISSLHFERVRAMLDDSGVKYVLEPGLVRGLDYYSHTVFEFQSSALGAQDSFGGGGRYDGLFEQLGGKATPAVGFAMGVERLLLILESLNKLPGSPLQFDYFVVCGSTELQDLTLRIAEKLRMQGFKVTSDIQRKSMKAQLREANKSGAKFAVIVGQEEAARNKVIIKSMATSEQSEKNIEEL